MRRASPVTARYAAPKSDGEKPLIVASGLALKYPGAQEPGLYDVDLNLRGGHLVILLGPNGGGKTTLFRGLTGELQPAAGELAVNAPVAYLPQHDVSRTDFPVTALDVALMGTLRERRPWRRAGREQRRRALEALDRVGLAHRARDAYGELSGGQRRRTLLARTIVQRAPVILLDEPLAGVDPVSAEVIDTALRGLCAKGRLVLVASHDIEHAKRADRVLCVNRRLVAAGPPGETLRADILRETYGSELTLLPTDGGTAGAIGAIEHHHHDDDHHHDN